MDGTSLAVGIPGLALLLIERWNYYRTYTTCVTSLAIRYDTQKIRLEDWQKSTGVHNNKLPKYRGRSTTAEKKIPKLVAEILLNIDKQQNSLSQKVEYYHGSLSRNETTESFDVEVLPSTESRLAKSLARRVHGKAKDLEKKIKGIKWSSGAKARVVDVVNDIEAQIDILYKLFPVQTAPSTETEQLIEDVSQIQSLIDELALQQRDQHKAHQKRLVYDWLNSTPFDYSHKNILNSCTPGTCGWFQRDSHFEEWDTCEGPRLLWASAPPGFGKSMLTANIVSLLKEREDHAVVYCFAGTHIASSGTLAGIPRLWLVQFMNSDNACLELAYSRARDSQYPTAPQDEVWNLLTEICSERSNCTLILDGIDEYEGSKADILTQLIKSVTASGSRLLLSSRPEEDIKSSLNFLTTKYHLCRFIEISIQPEHTLDDRGKRMKEIIGRLIPDASIVFQDKFKDATMAASDSSFLWLNLTTDPMHRGMAKDEMIADVQATPRGFEEIYDKYWEKILRDYENKMQRVLIMLSWILYSKRPLTLKELAEAKCISTMNDSEDDEKFLCPDSLPENIADFEEYVNKIFGPLLDIRDTEDGRIVRARHYSASEFIRKRLTENCPDESSRSKEKANQFYEAFIAKNCIKYLRHDDAWRRDKEHWQSEMWQNPALTPYAVQYWPEHASKANMQDNEFTDFVVDFMQVDSECFDKWAQTFEKRTRNDSEEDSKDDSPAKSKTGTPLYYSCLLLPMQFIKLVYKGDKSALNTTGGYYHTSIQAACTRNEPKIIEKICSWGADLTIEGGRYGTAVNAIATLGFKSCMKAVANGLAGSKRSKAGSESSEESDANSEHIRSVLNLKSSVQLDDGTKKTWTPLHCAAYYDHIESARSLLSNGAEVNVRDNDQGTPLVYAAQKGNLAIVELLIKKGADIEAATTKETDALNALNVASRYGRLDVVKFLISKKAKLDVPNECTWCPLDYAAFQDHSDVIKVLIEAGAPVNTLPDGRDYALYFCARRGGINSAKILLENGAKFYGPGPPEKFSPLHGAAMEDEPEFVKFMLGLGISTDLPRTSDGWYPIHQAASVGSLEVLQVLLESGASMEPKTAGGLTPVGIALLNGQVDAIDWLLNHNASLDCVTRPGLALVHLAVDQKTLLHTACLHGASLRAIQGLVEVGADIFAMAEDRSRPFDELGRNGQSNMETVEYLYGEMLRNSRGNFNSLNRRNQWDAQAHLPGLWKATYTYDGAEKAEKLEFTDFKIERPTSHQKELCQTYRDCFVMDAEDMHSPFKMFGQASFGDGGFRFNKLYPINGWLFLGTMTQTPATGLSDRASDMDEQTPTQVTISGYWGHSVYDWKGTFKLERTFGGESEDDSK